MCQQLRNSMNVELQNFFSMFYHSGTPFRNAKQGASSINGTFVVRQGIKQLFVQCNIKSMFDAGCNDCGWMNELLHGLEIDYQGGDISPTLIDYVHKTFPDRAVQVHDATTDAFPNVDLLFVRDVAIHLNHADKRRLWQNWLDSNIPWILITHSPDYNQDHNQDFEYKNDNPFISLNTHVNWQVDPWGFPAPVDQVWEYIEGGRCMALWNQNQFKGKI
jgi:hypothetical protein